MERTGIFSPEPEDLWFLIRGDNLSGSSPINANVVPPIILRAIEIPSPRITLAHSISRNLIPSLLYYIDETRPWIPHPLKIIFRRVDDTFLRRMSAINAVLPGKKLGIEKERRGDCHGSRRRWPRADERISLSASHEMGRLSFLLYGFLVGTMRTLFFRRTTPLVVTKPISQRALSRPSFLPILLPLPSPPFRPLVNLFFR